jgi:hypothetical protein
VRRRRDANRRLRLLLQCDAIQTPLRDNAIDVVEAGQARGEHPLGKRFPVIVLLATTPPPVDPKRSRRSFVGGGSIVPYNDIMRTAELVRRSMAYRRYNKSRHG